MHVYDTTTILIQHFNFVVSLFNYVHCIWLQKINVHLQKLHLNKEIKTFFCLGLVMSRPTRPVLSGTFGVPPRDTPRSRRLNPAPPYPLIVGDPASGTLGRTPGLDTLI